MTSERREYRVVVHASPKGWKPYVAWHTDSLEAAQAYAATFNSTPELTTVDRQAHVEQRVVGDWQPLESPE